jgi:hypothetical protein
MSFLFELQEHKLASACVGIAVLVSSVIVALIVLQSNSTADDVQGLDEFNAITANFTQRIELAFNQTLIPLDILTALYSGFDFDQSDFVHFLDSLAVANSNFIQGQLSLPFRLFCFACTDVEMVKGDHVRSVRGSRRGRSVRRPHSIGELHTEFHDIQYQHCSRRRSQRAQPAASTRLNMVGVTECDL